MVALPFFHQALIRYWEYAVPDSIRKQLLNITSSVLFLPYLLLCMVTGGMESVYFQGRFYAILYMKKHGSKVIRCGLDYGLYYIILAVANVAKRSHFVPDVSYGKPKLQSLLVEGACDLFFNVD
uniref:Uncharacterized protein n=1 Tax=Physcomitrium patens TaxID=3218 RepID=A0A2K1KA06_PHYPA|nr:hypothetical protein PHYPA_009796 [Physcomitrium patens]